MIDAIEQAPGEVPKAPLCRALSVSRATLYRQRRPKEKREIDMVKEPKASHRALTPAERQEVLDTLHSTDFRDQAPHEVYGTLLDQGRFLCSIRTMYRILQENKEVRERRNQAPKPVYTKPQLLATGANEVWSWDITKLLGPAKWTYFHLYVILDIFSRYVVGWMVAPRESQELAKRFISDTCIKQNIIRNQLTLHADRGSSMKSKVVAMLLADLGVTKTHSRPHTSNDNPFSESQFKTMKYRPEFPKKFGSLQDARAFCQDFFSWYNSEHHHSGLGLLTPEIVHYGQASVVTKKRAETLLAAYKLHPERFVRRPPTPPEPPEAVWINPPKAEDKSEKIYTNIERGVSQKG